MDSDMRIGIVGQGRKNLFKYLGDIKSKDTDEIQKEMKIQEEFAKLRLVGIDNPTEDDIGLCEFILTGIGIDTARVIKLNCDINKIPYDIALEYYLYQNRTLHTGIRNLTEIENEAYARGLKKISKPTGRTLSL